ncbi:anthranilate synthase component I family protein [Alicyclobacillus acidoterrestris]|uniref:anthranilate synthase component I family protein n=1 Tax=Alicyclobacillus acidoterrestris TaxID=1450 RepID=UPI003F539CAB
MQSYTYANVAKVDPFYLYLHAKSLLGDGQAFLLEAGRDDENAAYQMSLLGVCPVVEVQVKDGLVTINAIAALEASLADLLDAVEEVKPPGVWPSVVSRSSRYFRPVDPMAFLEELRIRLQSLCAPDMKEPFSAGFLGYVGYDGVHYLERLPKTTHDDRNVPDIRLQWHAGILQWVGSELTFHFQDAIVDVTRDQEDGAGNSLVNRIDEFASMLARVAKEGLREPEELSDAKTFAVESSLQVPSVQYDVSQERYCANVERAREYIAQGDIFQVVLSTRMRIEGALHPYAAYDALRRLNPSPYMFVAEYPGMRLYGASPEVQFRALNGSAEMKPIAGTSRGRGGSPEEDAALIEALKADEKESAEHVMLVDLCRNDLGRVCLSGSVHVPDFMVVERYSHLFHLVSRVRGTLRPDVSVFHALLSTFPNGTLSGAPKIRAMEIIDELETLRRGPYGGFIGMVDAMGNANTAIVIRSVLELKGTQYVQVGAGIVLDSVPVREWEECHHKAGAILDVLRGRHLV